MLDLLRRAKERQAERPRYWQGINAGVSAYFLHHVARDLDWLAANQAALTAALA